MVLTWDLMLAMDISILHGGLGAKLTVTGFGSENGSQTHIWSDSKTRSALVRCISTWCDGCST